MNIVVFNWQDRKHPQAGGAEAHLHEIFSRLVSRGHVVHLVTCGFEGAPATEVVDGMHVHRIGTRNSYNFHVKSWWRKHSRNLAVDVVVDDINKIPLMTPRFVKKPILGILHHLFGQSIFHEASFPAALYVSLAERMIPRVYARTRLAVVSESTRNECLQLGLPNHNISIIHNGINAASFPMTVGMKAPYPVITYFGRLKSYKCVDHVLRAFKAVYDIIPEARLWVIGRGDDQKRLQHIAVTLGVESAVTFHGFVDDRRKVELLSQSWIVVNPSIKEGWGITNIESNACGTPVVSADSPGLRDSVKIDVSGKLYPHADIGAMQELLLQLITHEGELRSLSASSVQWASQFSWDASADAMEQLLETCITS
ncbi:MAG: glycosyltransferase family 4 protein [Ignavibacteria bacterium]|nr:glycosyltransferase family 4 protein [Ignavibacteria bacterium]